MIIRDRFDRMPFLICFTTKCILETCDVRKAYSSKSAIFPEISRNCISFPLSLGFSSNRETGGLRELVNFILPIRNVFRVWIEWTAILLGLHNRKLKPNNFFFSVALFMFVESTNSPTCHRRRNSSQQRTSRNRQIGHVLHHTMATHSLIWLTLVACCLALTAAFPAAEQTGHSVQKRQIPASSTAVDAALRNPRFMRRQISCLLGEGNCDNIGRNLRGRFPSLFVSVLLRLPRDPILRR